MTNKLPNTISWKELERYVAFGTLLLTMAFAWGTHDTKLALIDQKLTTAEKKIDDLITKHDRGDVLKAIADAKVVNRLENLEVVIFGEVKTADQSANLK